MNFVRILAILSCAHLMVVANSEKARAADIKDLFVRLRPPPSAPSPRRPSANNENYTIFRARKTGRHPSPPTRPSARASRRSRASSPASTTRTSSRSSPPALGACLATVSFAAFLVTLVIAYLHAERALDLAEREAAAAAQTQTAVLTDIDRLTGDKRGDELLRAQRAVESLAERFPENGDIQRAAQQLEQARKAHARVKTRADRATPPARQQPFKR